LGHVGHALADRELARGRASLRSMDCMTRAACVRSTVRMRASGATSSVTAVSFSTPMKSVSSAITNIASRMDSQACARRADLKHEAMRRMRPSWCDAYAACTHAL